MAQRRNQPSSPSTSDAISQDRGGPQIPRVRKQAIALGVMVAVTTFINIVLYRLVEREVFYRPRVQSCAGHQGQAGDGQGSSQNPPISLLKTSLCLRTVSQYNLHDRQGSLPGQSCPWVRYEPGTEDSSSWRDLQPHLRETLCLHKALVTLDPDTAHRSLTLSEDGRRVGWTYRPQPRRDNPKRFTRWPCVLGREGFTSGRYYWEVQPLQDGEGWAVGVAQESVSREGFIDQSPEGGVWAVSWWWAVWQRGDDQYVALSSPRTLLYPRERPLKLGFYLDYEGGRLSVYNADTWEHLYTFNDSFTGGLHPYFRVDEDTDLRLV
ncbi:E3 ubiquitin-protein ligase TRIM58-like [Pleurodeles waltl]|uniref:E3 ubiquitin-protein ligase TRIM58-like n=1 Tax=Pleurodeles waltl TaxID=8319 RepID=UPI00370970ED